MSIAPGFNPGLMVKRISSAASNFFANGNTDFAAQQGIPLQVQMNKLFNNSTFCLLPSILWFEEVFGMFKLLVMIFAGNNFNGIIGYHVNQAVFFIDAS